MNPRVYKTLEFDKIIERLAALASSPFGAALCMELRPMSDPANILAAQRETGDALRRVLKAQAPSFSGIRDPGESLKRLSVGAMLNIDELLAIGSLLGESAHARQYASASAPACLSASTLSSHSTSDASPDPATSPASGSVLPPVFASKDVEGRDSLAAFFDMLDPASDLAAEISRCISDDGAINDGASPALSRIRRQIQSVHNKIRDTLQGMLGGDVRIYLQDAVVTMRNGRYCLPVKAGCKSKVPGMIQDLSSSGNTLFIEPMSVVRLNNDLAKLRADESREIEIILSNLSEQAAECADAIEDDFRILTRLDFIFAKAALAEQMDGMPPIFNTEGRIFVRMGRHPLLDPNTAVPIDIRLGQDFRLLIITGPNTGGKTVALKTVGLLTLMGQAGLFIPAGDRSELAVFAEVYADIGDEQSIEQSLSTFSAHMTNIVSILRKAGSDSLVLLDELCAGTDPEEGAALALSILEYLKNKGISVVATTHYRELKLYAVSSENVENACCEFSVESLSPTYRLLIGLPGKSSAFLISEKLGLPASLVEDAKARLTDENAVFEDVVADLEERRQNIEQLEAEAAGRASESLRLLESLREREERADKCRENIVSKAREEAAALLKEAKDTADDAIRFYHKTKSGSAPDISAMEKKRDSVRRQLDKVRKEMSRKTKDNAPRSAPNQLKPGDAVRICSMSLNGIVRTLPDADGKLYIQAGILRYQAHISDLELIDENPPGESMNLRHRDAPLGESPSGASTRRVSYARGVGAACGTGSKGESHAAIGRRGRAYSISPEINLIGQRADDALSKLEKYLDDACLSHLDTVRIIHGKGTGRLRQAVHDYLKRQSFVSSYHLGEFGEGDYGVTIAHLKQ